MPEYESNCVAQTQQECGITGGAKFYQVLRDGKPILDTLNCDASFTEEDQSIIADLAVAALMADAQAKAGCKIATAAARLVSITKARPLSVPKGWLMMLREMEAGLAELEAAK